MINKGISYIGVYFLRILSWLPFWFLYRLSDLSYFLIYYLVRYRRFIVRKNLKNSFPERSESEIIKIEKEFYRHFADMIFENIKLNSISKEEISKRVIFNGLDKLNQFYDSGRNVMMCTGHYGNWEMVSLSLSVQSSAKTVIIYKPLTNKIFENWFTEWRTKFGAAFIPMRQTLRVIDQFKGTPFILGFASDQSPAKDDAKYFLPFLHQQTAVMLGIEKMAKRTDSPIVYFKTNRLKRGYYSVDCIPICLHPQDTKPYEITKLHFSLLEKIIQDRPAYWLWSHNRWKHGPELE